MVWNDPCTYHTQSCFKTTVTFQNLFKAHGVDKNGKELYLPHVKSLTEKLSGYGVDRFTLVYPINLSSGEKIDENI